LVATKNSPVNEAIVQELEQFSNFLKPTIRQGDEEL
jgi:hypothetical protein